MLVGNLSLNKTPQISLIKRFTPYLIWPPVILSIIAPFIAVEVLTKYNPGHSTYAQRMWIFLWVPINLVVVFFYQTVLLAGRAFYFDYFRQILIPNGPGGDLSSYNHKFVFVFAALTIFVMVLSSWVFYETGALIMESQVCEIL